MRDRTTFSGSPQLSGLPGSSDPGRVRRWLAGGTLLVACLVVPWLIPWSGSASQSAAPPSQTSDSDPSTAAPEPDRPSAAPTTVLPDAGAIQRLRTTVRAQAVGNDVPVTAKDLGAVRTTPGPYRKVGRIEIDKIGLDVAFGEGVFAQTLDRGPGHWPGTPNPGRTGNAVLSGHRNTQTAPFRELDELDPGDKITTVVGDGKPTTFAVVKTTIVPEKKYKEFVLRQPSDPAARELTLFACHPEGNPVFRIVVQARAA